MRVPEHLLHKPIIGVDDYDKIDGKYSNWSDAKALSLGKSQWDEDEISAKVWRHTGEKWTRQSEELPLHRVLDLAILILSRYPMKEENIEIKTILSEAIINPDEISLIESFMEENKKYLEPRIKEIKRIVEQLDIGEIPSRDILEKELKSNSKRKNLGGKRRPSTFGSVITTTRTPESFELLKNRRSR